MFAVLMQRHLPGALSLASRMTGRPEDAEEVTQEAFLKVWSFAGQWQPDGQARFATWLYRVVYNLCVDRKRRQPLAAGGMLGLDAAEDAPATTPSAMDAYRLGEAEKVLQDGLASLPDRQRAALSLCYLGEMSMAEAAEILGISVSAVESLLVRGKRTLRGYFMERGVSTVGDIL